MCPALPECLSDFGSGRKCGLASWSFHHRKGWCTLSVLAQHLFGHQRKQKKIQDKNPDQCPVERVRPGLGGFYVQLSFTLQITFRSSSLNHVVLSADSSDLFEAVIHHCLRVASAGLTKVRDGKFVCVYIPFVQQAFLLFAYTVPVWGRLVPFHKCQV